MISPESEISRQLTILQCSIRNFSQISGVSLTTLADALAGRRPFDRDTASHCEDCLATMIVLHSETRKKLHAGINWSSPATHTAVVIRRLSDAFIQLENDHCLETAARSVSDNIPVLPQQS